MPAPVRGTQPCAKVHSDSAVAATCLCAIKLVCLLWCGAAWRADAVSCWPGALAMFECGPRTTGDNGPRNKRKQLCLRQRWHQLFSPVSSVAALCSVYAFVVSMSVVYSLCLWCGSASRYNMTRHNTVWLRYVDAPRVLLLNVAQINGIVATC